jgi:hypothetical protein
MGVFSLVGSLVRAAAHRQDRGGDRCIVGLGPQGQRGFEHVGDGRHHLGRTGQRHLREFPPA